MCNLDNIQTRSLSSVPELKHTLSHGIPSQIQLLSKTAGVKPLRLLVLDSIGTLFRPDKKTSKHTLFDRSREIVETASLLHELASSHHLAILIINEVHSFPSNSTILERNSDEIAYAQQARWFSRGDSVAGEVTPEAGLGLVWANQVGVRIMMTRTGRRRFVGISSTSVKRQHLDVGAAKILEDQSEEATLIRRLSVIFSSFSTPGSIDFIITKSGIVCLEEFP